MCLILVAAENGRAVRRLIGDVLLNKVLRLYLTCRTGEMGAQESALLPSPPISPSEALRLDVRRGWQAFQLTNLNVVLSVATALHAS